MKEVKKVTYKKVAFINKSKKGNLYFKLQGKAYVILDRDESEIGSNGSFATKVLVLAEENSEKG